MQLGSKGTIYIAMAITILGFSVIFLGWNGAAEKDYVSGQIPYVISGGLAGLGIIFAGLTVALVEARRRDAAKLGAKLDRLLEHLGAGVEDAEGAGEELASEIRSLRESRAKRTKRRKAS